MNDACLVAPSQHYDDAYAAPVLVYEGQLAPSQRTAAYAWLLLPSADGRPVGGNANSVAVTAVSGAAVTVKVQVDGEETTVDVLVELPP